MNVFTVRNEEAEVAVLYNSESESEVDESSDLKPCTADSLAKVDGLDDAHIILGLDTASVPPASVPPATEAVVMNNETLLTNEGQSAPANVINLQGHSSATNAAAVLRGPSPVSRVIVGPPPVAEVVESPRGSDLGSFGASEASTVTDSTMQDTAPQRSTNALPYPPEAVAGAAAGEDVSDNAVNAVMVHTCKELLVKLETVRLSVLHLQYALHAGALGVSAVETADRSQRLWAWDQGGVFSSDIANGVCLQGAVADIFDGGCTQGTCVPDEFKPAAGAESSCNNSQCSGSLHTAARSTALNTGCLLPELGAAGDSAFTRSNDGDTTSVTIDLDNIIASASMVNAFDVDNSLVMDAGFTSDV
jgi:hypothetical protein